MAEGPQVLGPDPWDRSRKLLERPGIGFPEDGNWPTPSS